MTYQVLTVSVQEGIAPEPSKIIKDSLYSFFQFALVETAITSMMDQWPKLRKWKSLVTLATCAAMFILGLPLCTDVGCFSIFKRSICEES